jgi:U6 snRNA-associated Sm-like protein LSm4
MLIELKNGDTYNGRLSSCNMFMNICLTDVICTSKDGDRFWKMPECYIRGNSIKYLRIPDEVITLVAEDEQNEKKKYQQGKGGRGGRGGGRMVSGRGGRDSGGRGGGGKGAGKGGRGGGKGGKGGNSIYHVMHSSGTAMLLSDNTVLSVFRERCMYHLLLVNQCMG